MNTKENHFFIETVSDATISVLTPSALNGALTYEKQYSQFIYLYEAAIELVCARLSILQGEFKFADDRNPISSISSRIKSKESIREKLQRKDLPPELNVMVREIKDIAGVRVICPFIEDVYLVARLLSKQKIIEILEVKDYIRNPKENGYRSLHLIANVEVDFADTMRKIPVEIQIRTIAMDFWASTEHQLRYKKDREFTEEIQQQLKECADLMATADLKMQDIAGDFTLEDW